MSEKPSKSNNLATKPCGEEYSVFPSPVTVLVVVTAAIFISEGLVMLFLSYAPSIPHNAVALLDASLISLLSLPIIFFVVYKPLVGHIAERKRTEDMLMESEEKYRSISETAMDAIVSVGSDGEITLFNKAAEKVFQYSREEAMGKNVTMLMPGKFKDPHQTGFAKYLKTHEKKIIGKYVELQGKRKDGEEFPMEISISSFEVGEETHFSAIIRDQSEKKRMEASFLQAEKLSSIGGLVAGVAHELNNPLTGIMGYSELILENENLDEQIRKDLEKIHKEAARSAKIVKNLLTFSREHKHEKKVVNINDIIEDTLNLVRHQLDLKGIRIETELAANLKAIFADEHQLQQAFINILNNASYAIEENGIPEGRIRVETKAWKGRIRIVCTNNGPKIDEEKMKKIFDPFFTTKEVGKGTGLGLSIVFGTIQDHHGTLEAQNLEPQGVSFTIELPTLD